MTYALNRRHLLAGTGAAGLAALLPSQRGRPQPVAPTVLTASTRVLEVNGRAAKVLGIMRDDGGRGLSLEQGQAFRVTLRNALATDTLVHWHGLTPPYRQDGVPGISAPALPPGGSARYDFALPLSGTYWMHSHQGLQEQALLAAPLIVRPRGQPSGRQEVVLMLHDFAFTSPEEIFARLRGANMASMSAMNMPGQVPAPDHAQAGMGGMGGMGGMAMAAAPAAMDMAPAGMAMDLNDVTFDAFLANERTLADPDVVRVERSGRVLLRIINGAAASNFQVDLGGVQARLVAVDGHAVQPVQASVFPVAMAQRIDLEVDMPRGQAVLPVLAVLEGERKRTGIVLAAAGAHVGKLDGIAQKVAAPVDLVMEQALHAAAPLRARPADRVLRADLTGAMQGYVWGINGRVYGQDQPLMVAKGERVELVMANRTTMAHPMHLHGHVFQVVGIGARRFPGAMRDTVLVPPMQSVTIAFDADNPGHWAFHCHNLYHMEAGMMTTVRYQPG